ncbi:MAG: hypothetical protein ACRD1T_22705, partial [Acidimicrobiia bacterium]
MLVLKLALLVFLPGYLLFRIPFADRQRRAALPIEERAFWAIILSILTASLVGLGLAAAEQYTLRRLLVGQAVIAIFITGVWRGRLRYGNPPARPGFSLVAILLVLAAGAFVFFPPSEYIIGGKDPGVYVNEGIQIAQRGALLITDRVVAGLPPEYRDLFFPSHGNPSYYSIRFMGFFIQDPGLGAVMGQFPHVYPLWIAIGYGLCDIKGALSVAGTASLLALLAFSLT